MAVIMTSTTKTEQDFSFTNIHGDKKRVMLPKTRKMIVTSMY